MMKKTILLTAICLMAISLCLFAQEQKNQTVKVYLKNGTWLPKNFLIITYAPGETGNGTNGFWIVPGFKKTVNYKVGTKIYLANQPQVNTVMSGKRIDNDPPFMIIKETDNEKAFYLK